MTYASALARRWQAKAAELERYGATEAARTHLALAAELEVEDRRWWSEPLSVKAAAAFRGVSESTIYRWQKQGFTMTRDFLLTGCQYEEGEYGYGIPGAGGPLERVIAIRGTR
jgi:hypothetical protein